VVTARKSLLNPNEPQADSDWFNQQVLSWREHHGRKDLPWQHNLTPYRVWVSEIMLQQTQVATVIPYYQRFMERFPDIGVLANASVDEVLRYWSGLGYYARGRNLHKAAQIIDSKFQGGFPQQIDVLQSLPGIGRSTAGAILAIACNQRHAILDGNVKRVLTRFHAIDGWPANPEVARNLWSLAEYYTPQHNVACYTQAIMDLGATLCRRARPGCEKCPLAVACAARLQNRVQDYPTPRPRKKLPVRQTRMLVLVNDNGEVLLEKRPPSGVWGGLWSLPEYSEDDEIHVWSKRYLHNDIKVIRHWPVLRHTFSHFHLDITPIHGHVASSSLPVMDDDHHVWYNPKDVGTRGVATPIARLISYIETDGGK
jgi:A/G-specific adenine glycosylase